MTKTKLCIHCNEYKSPDSFYMKGGKRHGSMSHCKKCEKRRSKKYYKNNKGKAIESRRQYGLKRRANDPAYRVLCSLRARLWYALKGEIKSASTIELTGYTTEQLQEYLSAQFTEGMSWDNYGEWHIDHIRPCASFDLIDPEQQRECFHYTNLQPLWAIDNIKKGDKYDGLD